MECQAEEVIAHENNKDYDPMEIFNTNADVRKSVKKLVDGTFSKLTLNYSVEYMILVEHQRDRKG